MKPKRKQSPVEIVENQRREVVEKVIEDMQKDGLRFIEPFLPTLSPHNPVSGTVYHGGNRMHLGFIGYMRGYTDNRWATFNQIKDAGWKVKKGAKSALIEKWKELPFYKENEDTGEQELVGRFPKLVGYWNVFNAEDIDGIPPEPSAPTHTADRTATIAENLKESSRCPVVESKLYIGQAAYSPVSDRILIAPRETFRSDEAFTRVLLHEMTHSTGHASALGRDLDTRFGSPSYAEEELVAELGSLFLSADLGIQSTNMEGEHYESHVAYLQSWVHALEDDPSYLFKAASKADHADTFIMERYEEELGKNIEIDAPELEEEVTLSGESHDMVEAIAVKSTKGTLSTPVLDSEI